MRQRVAGAVALVPGTVLAGISGIAGVLRPAAKPLHPLGSLRPATLTRHGLAEPIGVPWLDGAGTDDVLVRLSRATGFPAPLPDIRGLALRVTVADGQHADVLFASTGLGRWSRFVLKPARSSCHVDYSTLIPYRTPTGSLNLAAVPDDQDSFLLKCAAPGQPWRQFGELYLRAARDDGTGDESISFDPVTNQLPELDYPPWAASLREGAYRAARLTRGERSRKP
jgi:hypothetical protein